MTDGQQGESDFNLTFSALQVVTSPSDHYLDADWQTIAFAPLWVRDAVGNADRELDDRERAAFASTLAHPPPGVFPAFVFAHVRKAIGDLEAARESDLRTPMIGLADVDTLLRSYPNVDEATEFRRALVTLARNVANASGGGLLGRGPKISDAEALVISKIAATLRVPET